MSEIDYAARVAKGVALLDQKRPGWERQIDLEDLDIQSPHSCVTAQLSGVSWWRTGMKQLDLDMESYTDHGFRVDDDREGEDYPVLNSLWRDVVTERLTAAQSD